MIDEARSQRIQRIALLVIAVCLAPVVLLGFKALFLNYSRPAFAAPKRVALATPIVRTALTKAGTNLELNLTVTNRGESPITMLELRALRIDSTAVVSTKTSLGRIDPFTVFAKTYTIPMPAKLGPFAMVQYEIRYEAGPYDSGMKSGIDAVNVK